MLFYSVVSESDVAVQVLEAVKKIKTKGTRVDKLTENSTEYKQGDEEMDDVGDVWTSGGSESTLKDREEMKAVVERAMNRAKRKLPQVPCVVGFMPSPSSPRRRKAKNSDDEDDKDHVPFRRIKDLEVIPVVYSFDPVTRKLAKEIILTKLCEGPIQCSGYQVCSVGKYRNETYCNFFSFGTIWVY